MSQSIRVFRACCLLVLVLALPATAQQWSRDFGAMGLDGGGLFDGEGYCLGEFAGDLVVGVYDAEGNMVAASCGTYLHAGALDAAALPPGTLSLVFQGVADATALIRTGDRLTVDGYLGIVTIDR